MKNLLLTLLVLALTWWISQAVYVKDGKATFPLESVKKLKELYEAKTWSPRLAASKPALICNNENLPVDFKNMCKMGTAPQVFPRLLRVAENMDLCEICFQKACSGC
ncbi:guanylin-like [Discoglossus pictus]